MGFLYIFFSILLIATARRKSFTDRIFRMTPYRLDLKKEKNDKFSIKISSMLGKKDAEVGKFLILLLIIFSLIFVLMILINVNIFFAILMAATVPFLIIIISYFKKKKIRIKKEGQFEQFLVFLLGNLYESSNILNGIEKSIKDIENPLKEEFEIVIEQIRKGLLLNEALVNMINRNNSQVIKIILTGIITSNAKGADLIDYINSQIIYIREKKQMDSYIKILSSGPRYTSYLLMAIPIAVICIVSFINRNILEMLTTKIGIITIIYFALSNITGFCIINKLIDYQDDYFKIK